MKKLLIVMLIGIMVMVTACETSNMNEPDTHTSIYSWNRELINEGPSEVLEKLSDYHIDRVYDNEDSGN